MKNSRYSKFIFTKKTAVVLSLTVLLCFAGYKIFRHIGWKQLYDTGVKYSEQGEYKKAVTCLFAAVEHSPRKNKTYGALKEVFSDYGEYNTVLSLKRTAQTAAEISKLINGWYNSENYIPFNSKQAIDALTATSETLASDQGGYGVYDYDAGGNIIRKSFYTADGKIEKYIVNAYDEKGNQIITAEYNNDGTVHNGWINLYRDDGSRYRTVDFYPSGVIESIVDYDTDGRKTSSINCWKNGFAGGVTYYAENGYAVDSVLFYEDGGVYHIGMDYKENDRNRYVTISYDDLGYTDAITGQITPGNRMEVVFFSKYNKVADYHWVFLDTNTYKPQIALYGEKPVWSIKDLLGNY